VTVQVTHVNGRTGGHPHEPFVVWSDYTGRINTRWYVDPDDSDKSILLLTATGTASSLKAIAIFMDAPIVLVDNSGPDDYPGQKDLNLLSVDSGGLPNSLGVIWNWDDTGWTGNNTGDACSLYDTNGNGFANPGAGDRVREASANGGVAGLSRRRQPAGAGFGCFIWAVAKLNRLVGRPARGSADRTRRAGLSV
jgi:hypothetical protein